MNLNTTGATQQDDIVLSKQPDRRNSSIQCEEFNQQEILPVSPLATKSLPQYDTYMYDQRLRDMGDFTKSDLHLQSTDLLHHTDILMELVKHKLELLEKSIERISTYTPDTYNCSPSREAKSAMLCMQHKKCHGAVYGVQAAAAVASSGYSLSASRLSRYMCDLDQCSTCYNAAVTLFPGTNQYKQCCSIKDVNKDILQNRGVIVTDELTTQIEEYYWENLCIDYRSEKCTVIVDARKTKSRVLSQLMESLHTVQRSTDSAIDIARVLIDKPTQTGTIIVSSNDSNRSDLKIDVLRSMEYLRLHEEPENLPPELNGNNQQCNPTDYINFHQRLDGEVTDLCQSLEELFSQSHSLSLLPTNLSHCSSIIHDQSSSQILTPNHHTINSHLSNLPTSSHMMQQTLEHSSRRKYPQCLTNSLTNGYYYTASTQSNGYSHYCTMPRQSRHQSNGRLPTPAARPTLGQQMMTYQGTRQTLEALEKFTQGTTIFRSMLGNLNILSTITNDIQKLKELAERRLTRIYGCEKLWCYIEEITKNLSLQKKAHEIVNKFRTVSSNLRAAQMQQQRFSRVEPQIKRLLRQGNEVLSDVLQVICRSESRIEWLEQLATKLKSELDFLTSLTDKTRNYLHLTLDCYHRLEKAYDWAIDTMKFMTEEQMDNCMTHEALELLTKRLKSFIEHGTFVNDTIFDKISQEARFLSNRKLAEQCKTTKRRCVDTYNLLQSRFSEIERKYLEVDFTDHQYVDQVDVPASECCDNDCEHYIPLSSRSAPATPALTLRCAQNGTELKRRSQSLEDDMANRLYQYIQKEQEALGTQMTHHVPAGAVDDEATETFYECSSDLTGSIYSNTEDSAINSHNQNELRCDGNSDLQADSLLDRSYYSSVDPGEYFIANPDITIPLEEDVLHSNNNSIKSPTLENGGVITYSPAQNAADFTRPIPAIRKSTLTSTGFSTQSSLDSEVFQYEDEDETGSGYLPDQNSEARVRFDDIMEDQLSGITATTCTTLAEDNQLLAQQTSEAHSLCQVSPVISTKQKLTAMQKRRSFHGFTSSISLPQREFARSRKAAEINIKRLSVGSDVSECLENSNIALTSTRVESTSPLTTAEQLVQLDSIENSFKERESTRLLKNRRHDQTNSLVTASSDSLPSLPEEESINIGSSTVKRDHSVSEHWSPIPVNSHLISKRVLPTTRSSSMADLRLTESEIKSRVTLAHVMDELVQTEKDYVIALRLVVERYIPELAREDVPQTLRGKRGVIFGNIEKIYDFHNHYFLRELSKCEDEPFKISQCFLKHQAEFLMYAMYNKNKPKCDQLMAEYGSVFFKEQQLLMGDKMDLSSYLLKPVQRMGKYALILKQVLKECPETSPDYQELQSAEEMIRFCLQHGNDLLAMDALQDCDVNLQEQGTLLLQGEFLVTKNRRKTVRHIFLFEQLVLFSKPRKAGAGHDTYIYKTSLKTSDIGLTENVGTSGLKFEIWFRKRTGESWTVQAPTAQIKNKWVNVIEKILWTQALKSRESKLSELSTMGVGNKPCLDLKISADNIKDRFVPSFNRSMKERKLDRSTSLDKSDSNKKRPHSVISVAGSNSSNSSSGSNSGQSSSRRSMPFIDYKALGRLAEFSKASVRLRKMYRSDSRINRCDSGISSLSDGLSFTSPLKSTVTMPEIKQAAETQPSNQSEV